MNSNPIPPGQSVEDYFSANTNSLAIKKFSHSLEKYLRPGALTRNEADRVQMDMLLLFTGAVDIYFLKLAARFLTPETYDEIVYERNIEHMCGYPLCQNIPTKADGRPKICPNQKIIQLGDPDLIKFCCKSHAKASRFYSQQLSYEPVFMRMDISYLPYGKLTFESQTAVFEEIEAIAQIGKTTLTQAAVLFAQNAVLASKDLEESSTQDKSERIQEFEHLVGKLQDISIKERDPNDSSMTDMNGVEDEELIGDHTAVEGYKAKN